MDFAGNRWSEILQNAAIVAGLFLSAYTFWREEQARRVSNLLDITQQYREVWNALQERPELSRVLRPDADVEREPPTNEEEVFVTTLIFHLDAAHEAMRAGMLARLHGLRRDVREFFSLPVPRAVWEKVKPLQNRRLVGFIEAALGL